MAIRRAPVTAILLLCLLPALSACGQTSAKRQATPTLPPTPMPTPMPTPPPKSWNLVASPQVGEEGNLADVTVISAHDAWAVGSFYGVDALKRTLAEHWDGATWSAVASPNPSSIWNELDAVSGVSANDVWAVGQTGTANFKSEPVIEHWNGTNWAVSPSPSLPQDNNYLTGIAAVSSTTAWAVGYTLVTSSSRSVEKPLIMRWDGSAWKLVASPALSSANGGELHAVTAIAANDVWAVGDNTGSPLIEHWNGSSWTVAQENASSTSTVGSLTDGPLTSVSGDGANDVWAVGSGLPDFASGGCGWGDTLVMEHWNGQRWSTVNFPMPAQPTGGGYFNFNHVAAAAPNDVWAVGGMEAYTVRHTMPVAEHWDGAHWSIAQQSMPPMVMGFASVAARSGEVFAVGQTQLSNGNGATVVGQWNGSQWARVDSPSPGTLSNALNGVSVMSANDVWAVGDSAAGTLSEHWDGAHWSVVPTVNGATDNNHLNAVAGTGTTDVWAVGVTGTHEVTEHWDGSSWTLVPAPTSASTSNSALFGVATLSKNDAWAVGSAGAMHWNGSAWSISAGAPDSLLSVSAVSSSDVWAVGGQRIASCGGPLPAIIAHWNGRQWSSIPNMPQGVLESVSAVSSSDVWAVGGGISRLIMRWDGQRWTQVTLTSAQRKEMMSPEAVVARASDDVWVVGEDNTLRLSILHWDGHTWTYTPIKPPGQYYSQFTGVAAVSAGEVWAVGSYSRQYRETQALIERYIA